VRVGCFEDYCRSPLRQFGGGSGVLVLAAASVVLLLAAIGVR
jgi:hypothetical protein